MKKCISAIAGMLALVVGATSAEAESKPLAQHLAWLQPNNIYHSGLRGTHTVALTFDDGPNRYTPAVLDALKALGVRATFFIVGKMAKAHPEMLARIAAEGHLLANHSATHPLLGRRYDKHPELLDQAAETCRTHPWFRAQAEKEERERQRLELIAAIEEGEASFGEGDIVLETEEDFRNFAEDIKQSGRAAALAHK